MGEWRYSSTILDVSIKWEWSALRSGRFTSGEKTTGTHMIGGWVVPRASLDAMEKRKILPLPGIEPQLSSP
jgi:hypothetical protein